MVRIVDDAVDVRGGCAVSVLILKKLYRRNKHGDYLPAHFQFRATNPHNNVLFFCLCNTGKIGTEDDEGCYRTPFDSVPGALFDMVVTEGTVIEWEVQ
jgi:hypothetical protein